MIKAILLGTSIAFLMISFFVFGVDQANPNWGKFWMVKPLILTPLAGAVGGYLFNFLKVKKRPVIGLITYAVVLWLGVVLGLNGTMWD